MQDELNEPTPFTQDEIARFKKRYNEGYDIKTDDRYKWLADQECFLSVSQTTIAHFLQLPEVKYPETSQHQASAYIITSNDYRCKLMEKQKQKQDELERKAFNKAERERKQKEKKERAKSILHINEFTRNN
jgi:protease II